MRRIAIAADTGFVSSAVSRCIIATTGDHVRVTEKLSYVGNLVSLAKTGYGQYLVDLLHACPRQY